MSEHAGLNDSELVHSLGTDAAKWARAFKQINNPSLSDDDEHTLLGWFANAIEHAKVEATSRARRGHAEQDAAATADNLTASESLFGFVGWLTTRHTVVELSAAHTPHEALECIRRFCDENQLSPPRDGWHERLAHPAHILVIDGPLVGGTVTIAGSSQPSGS